MSDLGGQPTAVEIDGLLPQQFSAPKTPAVPKIIDIPEEELEHVAHQVAAEMGRKYYALGVDFDSDMAYEAARMSLDSLIKIVIQHMSQREEI